MCGVGVCVCVCVCVCWYVCVCVFCVAKEMIFSGLLVTTSKGWFRTKECKRTGSHEVQQKLHKTQTKTKREETKHNTHLHIHKHTQNKTTQKNRLPTVFL